MIGRQLLATIGFACLLACGQTSSGSLGDANVTTPDATARPDAGLPDAREPVLDAGDNFAPDCLSCRADGETCTYSINCQAGSICNDPIEELYDPTKPQGTCIPVLCMRPEDCTPPKYCSPEGVCRDRICQIDQECPGGSICVGGRCEPPPNPSDVAYCEVLTPDRTLLVGQTLQLSALAFDANGAAVPGVVFEWTTSNEQVLGIMGDVAIAGPLEGEADLTALFVSPGRMITCAGPRIFVVRSVSMGSTRVRVVAEESGQVLPDVEVTIFSMGMPLSGMTGPAGIVLFPGGPIDSVTAVEFGRQSITVIDPGTNDIVLALPRARDRTVSAGFRGMIDLSTVRQGDISMAIARGSLSSDFTRIMRGGICADAIETIIDAPELALNMEVAQIPANFTMRLGNKNFTDDGMGPRCQGDAVPTSAHAGCFLANGSEGVSAAWSIGGQFRLTALIPLANQLSEALGGSCSGLLLDGLSTLSRSMHHGLHPAINLTAHPKVAREASMGMNCLNPLLPDYELHCQSDYLQFQRRDIAADHEQNVFSIVSVPDLPVRPGMNACADAVLLLPLVELPQRGLVPLGFSTALDADANCRVDARDNPFGPSSAPTLTGEIALVSAPRHSGAEGHPLVLGAFAFPQELDGRVEVAAVIAPQSSSLNPLINLSSRPFLAYPQVTISRGAGAIAVGSSLNGVAAIRIDLEHGNDSWIIYAPADAMISLPNVAGLRSMLINTNTAWASVLGTAGTYSQLFTFASQLTLERPLDSVRAFSMLQCGTDPGSCTIQ